MPSLEDVDRLLAEFADLLASDADQHREGEGIVMRYAAVMSQRLRATFLAMTLLLTNGYHEPALPLYRRQLEDSVRLHYLHSHRDAAPSLILGLQAEREAKVLRALDRTVNALPAADPARPELVAMANTRRQRVRELERTAHSIGVELTEFPDFDEAAVDVGRQRDVIPYASASEAAHSAISAAAEGYVQMEGDSSFPSLTVGLRSESLVTRASYARAAINATGLALYHAHGLLSESERAGQIAREAAARVQALSEM